MDKPAAYVSAEPGWFSIGIIEGSPGKIWRNPIIAWAITEGKYDDPKHGKLFNTVWPVCVDFMGDGDAMLAPDGRVYDIATADYDSIEAYMLAKAE